MPRMLSRAAMACIAFTLGCTGIASAAPQSGPERDAIVTTCDTPYGRYDVTAPEAAPGAGADPAEVAAANCTLGFHEERQYPLSVIGLALLTTIGTLMLARTRQPHDLIGSEA